MVAEKYSRQNRRRHNYKDACKVCFAWLAIGAIIFGVCYAMIVHEQAVHEDLKAEYNNGICLKCGGHYHLVAVKNKTASNSEIYYYYECEKCYHVVAMNYLPQ